MVVPAGQGAPIVPTPPKRRRRDASAPPAALERDDRAHSPDVRRVTLHPADQSNEPHSPAEKLARIHKTGARMRLYAFPNRKQFSALLGTRRQMRAVAHSTEMDEHQ